MDYNTIWQGLQGQPEPIPIPVSEQFVNICEQINMSLGPQQWVSIKEQLEVIRDDLDNIHCDIESEDHRYCYVDWDTITCNIRNMQTYIDKIKEILAKYIKEENG